MSGSRSHTHPCIIRAQNARHQMSSPARKTQTVVPSRGAVAIGNGCVLGNLVCALPWSIFGSLQPQVKSPSADEPAVVAGFGHAGVHLRAAPERKGGLWPSELTRPLAA
jgi:hypothetical protein